MVNPAFLHNRFTVMLLTDHERTPGIRAAGCLALSLVAALGCLVSCGSRDNSVSTTLGEKCETYVVGKDDKKIELFRSALLAAGSGVIFFVERKGRPLVALGAGLIFLGESTGLLKPGDQVTECGRPAPEATVNHSLAPETNLFRSLRNENPRSFDTTRSLLGQATVNTTTTPMRSAIPIPELTWIPGHKYSTGNPNVIASLFKGTWHPAPGYRWLVGADDYFRDDNNDLRVTWNPGVEYYSHVFSSNVEGKWRAAPGYRWVNRDDNNDLRVTWNPGVEYPGYPKIVASNVEGEWRPASGYTVERDAAGHMLLRR